MFRTTVLYIRQRCNPVIFLLLAVFLMHYGLNFRVPFRPGIIGLFYTLVLLFWFRLFDDIASRKVDAQKSERIYTHEEALPDLLLLLLVVGVVLLSGTFLIWEMSGILVGSFMVLNALAYRALFERGEWRRYLPLMKYPFFAFLLFTTFGYGEIASVERLLVYLSLLPIFILFEWFNDPSLHLSKWVVLLLFVSALLLVWPAMGPLAYVVGLIGGGIGIIMYWKFGRAPVVGYVLVTYFAALRYFSLVEGDWIR